MPERRKQAIKIPIFNTFLLAFVVIISGLILAVIIFYYSFTRRLEKSKSDRWKEKPLKVNRFLELSHGQEEQIKDNEKLYNEKLYYATIAKILSLGNRFNSKCRETSVNGNDVPIQENSKKLHLGIFTLSNLAVISDTTHPFEITLKNWDSKVYFQVVAVGTDRKPYIIHFFERPSFTIQPWRTYIQLCGVFYRMIRYENIKDKETNAPLFLTYTIGKYIEPPKSNKGFTTVLAVVIVILLVVFMFLRHKSKVKEIELGLKGQDRKE